ncbi:hypothetical protein [Pseudoalteromonas maricaloris]|uniref:hypothetical protein n=1 Tax=Pseudoalteromonas maricaloris TaxID=184924 RepID=UPI003C284238
MKANQSIESVTKKISKVEVSATYEKSFLKSYLSITIHIYDYRLFYFENAIRSSSLTRFQSILNKKSCPPPFYLIGFGDFERLFHEAKTQDEFEGLVFSLFTPINMAVIYNQMFSESPILSKHCSTIFESMETYWLGMDFVSTDSLITVFESSLRDLIERSGRERPGTKFKTFIYSLALERLSHTFEILAGFYWYPFKSDNVDVESTNQGSSEEQLWVLLDHTMDSINAFLIWFSGVLYKEHGKHDKGFSLNRHNIVHGFTERKASPVHYPLMLWALLSLIYIESFFVSLRSDFSFPKANEQDIHLSHYFESLCARMAEPRRKVAKSHGVNYKG